VLVILDHLALFVLDRLPLHSAVRVRGGIECVLLHRDAIVAQTGK